MKRLDGKSALITGAARGIGKAFAKAYVAEGATVAIGDIDVARAEESAAEIGPGAYVIRLDVTDQASIDQAIRTVETEDRRAGHPGQQHRRVRPGADRRDHPRKLQPAVRHQRRRNAVHPSGRPPDP